MQVPHFRKSLAEWAAQEKTVSGRRLVSVAERPKFAYAVKGANRPEQLTTDH